MLWNRTIVRNASFAMAISFGLAACMDKDKPVAVDTDEQKIAYTIGYNFGKQLKANAGDIDQAVLIGGLKDGLGEGEGLMTDEQMQEAMNTFRQQRQQEMQQQQEAAATDNKEKGDAFLAENKAKEGVVTTESGLQYKVVTEGSGAKPSADDKVTVHYRGTLVDGTEFDSSYARGNPATFPVKGVIPGWTEALQLMKEGAKWELYIPSDLAYGPRGPGKIGPNATLVFEVELINIGDPKPEE